MKSAAFKLVAFVVGAQVLLLIGVSASLITKNERCTGDKIQEMLTGITAQAFALYAAEKYALQ